MAPRKHRRRGLSGDITRVAKCPTCGKMVRSDRLAKHVEEHLDQTDGRLFNSRERIERIFKELEHLQSHNDPDCPDCRRIASKVETVRIKQVRSAYMSLVSGAVTILGRRMKPYSKNAWHYTVMVQRGPDGESKLLGGYTTEDTYLKHGLLVWRHNDGPGTDEGGNNRAAFLLDVLVDAGVIDSDDIEGTRDNPLYRAKMGPDIGDEP